MSVCTRTKGKRAVTPQKTESNLLSNVGESSAEEKGGFGSCRDKGTGGSSSG